jgi:uncharacterized protein YidB (DUF937 family)
MGLFERVMDAAESVMKNSGHDRSLKNGILDLFKGDGLNDIVKKFKDKGLGDIISSWIGIGKNLPISSDQLKKGLGAARIKELAKSAGIPEGKITGILSGLLPSIIDKATPSGKIEDDKNDKSDDDFEEFDDKDIDDEDFKDEDLDDDNLEDDDDEIAEDYETDYKDESYDDE